MKSKPIPTLVKDPALVQERRKQIVDAAVKLFIRKGFHKTTTREIAAASQMSVGSLYEYVQSKEDVLYLVCDAIHSEVEARLREALRHDTGGRERLADAIRQYFRVMDTMQDDVLLIYQETKSLPRESMAYVLRREEQITRIFEDIIRRGVEDGSFKIPEEDIPLMAHNIIVLGQMWTFRRWALRSRYSLEQYAHRQISLLMRELTAWEGEDHGNGNLPPETSGPVRHRGEFV